MPRSFLIVNKRYKKKQDRNHNVKNITETEYFKGEKHSINNNSFEHTDNNRIQDGQKDKTEVRDNDRHQPVLSVKTLLPRDSNIPHSWTVPEVHHDPGYDLSLFYVRPLHHIFRQLQPSHNIFLPSPPPQTLPICNRRFEDESFDRLNALVEKVFDEIDLCDVFVCDDCGKTYSTSSNLARHKQIHRDISDKKARKCPHCEKVYVSMPAFSMHVRTHSQGCVCPYCGKRFSRPWLLQGHIRTHTGEKPFACPKCSKAFADKSNLRAHIQTHSTEKPYTCGRCGKAFALKSYLSKHEESSCMRGLKYHKLHCAFLPGNV